MVQESLKLSNAELRDLHRQNVDVLSKMLQASPETIEQDRKALSQNPARAKEIQDPDNFARILLTEATCHDLKAKKVLGGGNIKSCKTTPRVSDGIRAIFLCDHPLSESSIRDNFNVTEIRHTASGSQANTLAINMESSSIIFRNKEIDRDSRASNIANEAAHQILNSRTTLHQGEWYRNIYHFRARGPDISPDTPQDLLNIMNKTVPQDLSQGISFKNRVQVHELISDCASTSTNLSDVTGIINNVMSAPKDPNSIESYKQTNTFAARQAVKYLVSLPAAENESEKQLREAALILLRNRISHGYFKETPYIRTSAGDIHPGTVVTEALGEQGAKFIQQQYLRLGKKLIESIVDYNTRQNK